MNFGMDYFTLLTGGINSSTNSILNQYGKQKVGKNSKGNGISKMDWQDYITVTE